ncbi:hypothetical protein Ahy_B08g091934 isoform D [Arachis hypogaea]|uniref:Uncharacterized protein n=1 Tax=Arachis hypogaea TaxID=3818 RepID=A0A444Y2T1_ARAHY|nr:hypothetical protein Ahy_B08g091934 isoform D [Arachis hypogaea]
MQKVRDNVINYKKIFKFQHHFMYQQNEEVPGYSLIYNNMLHRFRDIQDLDLCSSLQKMEKKAHNL